MHFWKLFAFLLIGFAHAGEINIGYIEFSPFIYKNEKGEVVGSIPSYTKKVFIQDKIIWKHIPLKRVSRSLNEDKIDVFVSLFKSAQREKEVEFHNVPYYELKPTVCALSKRLPKKIVNFDMFKKKKVLTVLGTLISDKFPKTTNFYKIKIQDYKKRSISMILSNRIDYAYFGDDQTVYSYLKKQGIKNIECRTLPIKPYPIYMVSKKGSPLKFRIDARIKEIGKMSIP
jgi:ABC-type amino acid transport substrate-binding protein